MKDITISVSKETRMVDLSKKFLGNDGENLQANIIFKFSDEFVNGQARLEYKTENEEKNYIVLDKTDETYFLPIKNVLTKQGTVDMQLVITEGINENEIPVFKSKPFYLWVNESINAVTEAPEGYELWIEKANEKLNEFDLAIKQIDNLDINAEKVDKTTTITITKKDGTKKEVEIKDYELTEKDKQELINSTTEAIQPQFDEIHEEVAQLERDIVNTDNRVTGLQEELQDQEETLNHLDDIKANKEEIPTKISELENDNNMVQDENYVHTDNNYTTEEKQKLEILHNYDDTKVKTDIQEINDKIPTQASKSNQLSDKDFVNSSINSITAFYITKNADGEQFNTKEELDTATEYYSGGEVRIPTRNDYCIVLEDESKDKATTRYIYQNGQWEFQYIVNETALTAEQLKALNSGITLELVSKLQGIDLSDVIKNTDYATSSKGGTVKVDEGYGTGTGTTGFLYARESTYDKYLTRGNDYIIGKGTLENVLNARIGNIDTILTRLTVGEGVE